MTDLPIGYEVSNRITGKVTQFKTGAAAIKFMDRTNRAYGATITTRRALWAEAA